ncbi:hypothetical protein TOK_4664 [Pseudonocardia sp. N23]|nr:hypothetical protein TOK_4664 [Pseudonocardia sp. N23]
MFWKAAMRRPGPAEASSGDPPAERGGGPGQVEAGTRSMGTTVANPATTMNVVWPAP